jgi:hypothetical protein
MERENVRPLLHAGDGEEFELLHLAVGVVGASEAVSVSEDHACAFGGLINDATHASIGVLDESGNVCDGNLICFELGVHTVSCL